MTADELQKRLARVIRHHRESLGFSQEAFADHIEVHRTYYGAFERAKQNITLRRLTQIADGLGIKLSRLFLEAESRRIDDLPAPRGPGRPKSVPVQKKTRRYHSR